MNGWRICAAALLLLIGPTASAGVPVEIDNVSQSTGCAENDNIYVKFAGAGIRRFVVEARHPAYLTPGLADETAADFTSCDESHDPSYAFDPLDVTLYEDGDYRLVGHRFARFWRPESVDLRVGQTVTHGLHLVQLIRKLNGHAIEVLVVYPSDGYCWIKPLPPAGRPDTGYGSSFLAGPIQEEERPYVPLHSIAFDRSALTFHLSFRGGGEGALRVAEASSRRTRVEITLPPSGAVPFAALRSMFVSPEKSDTAEVRLDADSGSPAALPILDLRRAEIVSVIFSRSLPSHHNTSAPDLEFHDFAP